MRVADNSVSNRLAGPDHRSKSHPLFLTSIDTLRNGHVKIRFSLQSICCGNCSFYDLLRRCCRARARSPSRRHRSPHTFGQFRTFVRTQTVLALCECTAQIHLVIYFIRSRARKIPLPQSGATVNGTGRYGTGATNNARPPPS